MGIICCNWVHILHHNGYGIQIHFLKIASEQGKREVRKLEAKLHQASDATDLQSKYARLKSKVTLRFRIQIYGTY